MIKYQHKKFDRVRAVKDDELKIKSENIKTQTLSEYGDSSCSVDVVTFAEDFRGDSSTPLLNRCRLNTDDSGIYLSPNGKMTPVFECSFQLNNGTTFNTTNLKPMAQLFYKTATSPALLMNDVLKPTPTTTTTAKRTTTPAFPLIKAVVLPEIDNATLNNIVKYHSNMVRTFPKKQRTAKDQERRDKNTLACRLSRRNKIVENILIEKQYTEFRKQHREIEEKTLRARAYLRALKNIITVQNGAAEQCEQLEEKPTTSHCITTYYQQEQLQPVQFSGKQHLQHVQHLQQQKSQSKQQHNRQQQSKQKHLQEQQHQNRQHQQKHHSEQKLKRKLTYSVDFLVGKIPKL